jgi:two-component system response regulator (stage 0 sporulation protein F)
LAFKPSKGKVLIADDDDLLREAFVSILQSDGWETIEARDGKEALEKILSETVDVVILDQRMPEMTGSEVYQQLVRIKKSIPVIFVTAAAEIEDIASELGIVYYLAKPVGFEPLLKAVQRAAQGDC